MVDKRQRELIARRLSDLVYGRTNVEYLHHCAPEDRQLVRDTLDVLDAGDPSKADQELDARLAVDAVLVSVTSGGE